MASPDAEQETFRQATAEDVAAVIAITNEAYARYVPIIGRKPQPMETDYLPMIEAGEVWLIDVDGQLAGLIVLTDEADRLLIYSVAVRPTFQKRGLGRRLLDWAETRAAVYGYELVRLYTNALMVENIALYQRVGYTETGRETYKGGIIVYMEKRLEG